MTTARTLHRLAFAAYAGLIAWLSLRQSDAMLPGQWDKAEHLLAYAVFAGLGALLASTRSALCLIGAGIVAYGGLLEIGQSFVPGRFPSALDLLANAVGVLLGGTLAAWRLGIGPPRRAAARPGAAALQPDRAPPADPGAGRS